MTRTEAARIRGMIADLYPQWVVTAESSKTGVTINVERKADKISPVTNITYDVTNGPSMILRQLVGWSGAHRAA